LEHSSSLFLISLDIAASLDGKMFPGIGPLLIFWQTCYYDLLSSSLHRFV
jgi:hypothetical protein